jgi:hypothetical protein
MQQGELCQNESSRIFFSRLPQPLLPTQSQAEIQPQAQAQTQLKTGAAAAVGTHTLFVDGLEYCAGVDSTSSHARCIEMIANGTVNYTQLEAVRCRAACVLIVGELVPRKVGVACVAGRADQQHTVASHAVLREHHA